MKCSNFSRVNHAEKNSSKRVSLFPENCFSFLNEAPLCSRNIVIAEHFYVNDMRGWWMGRRLIGRNGIVEKA